MSMLKKLIQCSRGKTAAALAQAALAALVVSGSALAQSLPHPGEAKLYENAKKEGSVVWYSGGALEPTKAFAAKFEQKYPGVRVEIQRLIGAQQYQRFVQESQSKRYIADVLWLSDRPSMSALIDDNQIVDWPIPTLSRFAAQYKIKQSAYAFNLVNLAIVYNEKKVTEAEARRLESGWQAVLDPAFSGRFAATTARCGACYAAVHMFVDPKLKSTYPANFTHRIGQQKPAIYSDFIAMIDRVVAGEQDFAYWSFESIAALKRAQGAPIRWVYPVPTPSFPSTWMAVPKNAPHPNAARLFIDWVGSEEGARSLQIEYFSASTMQGVPDLRPFVKEAWYKPPRQLYQVNFDRWEKDYDRDFDQWIKDLKAN
jgi:iron(III) transport system substrate-binding protein